MKMSIFNKLIPTATILKFLVKNWKDVALIGLVIFCISSVHSCYQNKQDNDRLMSSVDSLQTVTRQYRDHNDKLVFQAKTHLLTIGELRDNVNRLGIDKRDLEKQVGRLNNLEY